MPSLTNLLAIPATSVFTGEVTAILPNDLYQVKLQGQDRALKSAVPASFSIGTKVLVAKTEDGEFIIGKSSLTSRSFTEVTIRG